MKTQYMVSDKVLRIRKGDSLYAAYFVDAETNELIAVGWEDGSIEVYPDPERNFGMGLLGEALQASIDEGDYPGLFPAKPFEPITDRAKQIWNLFEGTCPDCGEDTTITRVAGTADWLENFTWTGDHEVMQYPTDETDRWPNEPVETMRGSVDFRCEEGHEHYTEWSHGDWSRTGGWRPYLCIERLRGQWAGSDLRLQHKRRSLLYSYGKGGATMKVLIACEFSGAERDAFKEKGHDAWSCDLLPSETPGQHIEADVMTVLDQGWDLMIAHPPCTYLASSGLHWNTRRPERQALTEKALKFVQALMDAPIKHIALENPIGCISTRIRKPDQIIQPWQFGHAESKATCLWLKNLSLLEPTDILTLPESGRWENQTPSGQNKLGPSPDRWKLRSLTYRGIAKAMAEQWSNPTGYQQLLIDRK
jgi:hypothetical protein